MHLRSLIVLSVMVLAGCSGGSSSESDPIFAGELRVGTAPPGGAFNVVGEAISGTLNEFKGRQAWQVSALETQGSMENIERLSRGELHLALSNAAITFFAAEEGYPVRAVMTLAPNVAMFVAPVHSGLTRISDLTGKKVFIGPRGAGFELFLMPIFVAHDAQFLGLQPVHGSQMEAVEMLRTGEIDAAFIGGAVPTESLRRAGELMDLYFIPFDEIAAKVLKQEFIFYTDATIPAGTYKGQENDFHSLNVGSMHLITAANLPEALVYVLTKTIYENRARVADKHPAGRAIHPQIVIQNTGVQFHPGAIRYYKEIGIWPDERD